MFAAAGRGSTALAWTLVLLLAIMGVDAGTEATHASEATIDTEKHIDDITSDAPDNALGQSVAQNTAGTFAFAAGLFNLFAVLAHRFLDPAWSTDVETLLTALLFGGLALILHKPLRQTYRRVKWRVVG